MNKYFYIEITPYKGETFTAKFWTVEFKPLNQMYFKTHEEAQSCADKNIPVGRFKNIRVLSKVLGITELPTGGK